MSKEQNEINVRLTIYRFNSHPDEITQILGLIPTDIWIAGQPMHRLPGSRVKLYKENAWLLKSPLDGSPEIEEQVDALISVIAPQAGKFQSLPDNVRIELSCSVYGYEYMPAIHFTADQVRFLASLGAEIDVDVYDLTHVTGTSVSPTPDS